MSKKKEVAIVEEMPAYLQKLSEEDNRGNENITKDDLVIPRLSVVQALSPEIKKTDPAYIEGAEQGMLFNTVTRELYPDGVVVVPIMFNKFYLVWRDRKLGGGFGGQFEDERSANDAILGMAEDGYEVVDTPTHLALLVDGDSVQEIAIPMPRSKAKVSRQWNSMIRMLGGPRFSRAYRITGVEDKSDLGEFYNFRIDQAGFPSEKVFNAAEALYEQLSETGYKMDSDEKPEAKDESVPF